MITAYGSVEAAVDALKLGANDYFSKPWDNEKLIIEIDRMIARRLLEYENTHLKRALKQRYSFPNIIGKSERMVRLLDLVGAGGAQPLHHPDHGRDRHRQGTRGQGDPRQLAARRPDVRGGELRLAAAGPAGIHAVRPRQGRLHQRHPDQEGLLRSRRPRHDFLRRDRHAGAGNADQAAARDSGEGVHRAGRRPSRSAWTCASWRPPTRTWRNW